jgi:hypothetical protein
MVMPIEQSQRGDQPTGIVAAQLVPGRAGVTDRLIDLVDTARPQERSTVDAE